METNEKVISSFRKFKRKEPFEGEYRVASVEEAELLLKAIKAIQEESSSSTTIRGREAHILITKLLPQSKDEAFALRDGYLFDFGTVRTFYPDMEKMFTFEYKLGIATELANAASGLCLPLALLHACADEDEKEIRDLVMVQSVYRTFGQHVPKEREHELEQEVPSRSMNRGFFLVKDPDGRVRSVHAPQDLYTFPALWGASFAGAGMGEKSVDVENKNDAEKAERAAPSADQKYEGQPQSLAPQAQNDIGFWPPTNYSKQNISPLEAKLALLHAYTVWPKRGGTALDFAAATGRHKVVNLLLELEVEIKQSASALFFLRQTQSSAAYFSLSSWQLLIGDNDGNNPLCCAAEAEENNSKVVKSLLKVDFEPDINIGIPTLTFTQRNKFGMAAVMIAASKGHMSTLCCLLSSSFFLISSWQAVCNMSPFTDMMESNNLFHYCVQRTERGAFEEILKALPGNDESQKWYFIADGMLQNLNASGANALDVALEKGRSHICELVLRTMNEHIRKGDMQIAFTGMNFLFRAGETDCHGNNVLHRYALGGGSREAGKALIEWLTLSASWLHKFSGSSLLARRGLREWHGQVANLSTMDAMINQLNCAGETPCITALKRGHTDALQVLLPFWSEERASRYRNPVGYWADNFLHCYAKSKARFDLTSVLMPISEQQQGYSSNFVETLITVRNKQGHTPIMSSLYSEQPTSFKWFLQQKQLDVQVQQSDHALHVYAYYCDDTEVGSELIERLGEEQAKAELGTRTTLRYEWHLQEQMKLAAADANRNVAASEIKKKYQRMLPLEIKGTPLKLAIAGGNLQACEALILGGKKHDIENGLLGDNVDESMDDDGNNVLHLLCLNIKSGNKIEEFWSILATATERGTTSNFAKTLINAQNNDGETPLIQALQRGNTTAAEWLLQTLTSDDQQTELDEHITKAVFDAFQEGECRQLGLWKKLKAFFCRSIADGEHADLVLKHVISTSSPDFLQDVMVDNNMKTISDIYGKGFYLAYAKCVSNLENVNALMELKRNMQVLDDPLQNKLFHKALKKGNLEVLEVILQEWNYDHFEEEFNKDQYHRFLENFFCGLANDKLALWVIQKLHVNKSSSPIVSWQRFLNLVGKKFSAALASGTWAVWNLTQRARQVEAPVEDPISFGPVEILEDVAAEVRKHLSKALMRFVKVARTEEEDSPNVLFRAMNLWRPQLAGESSRESRAAALYSLLMEVQVDHSGLVFLLLGIAASFLNDQSSGRGTESTLPIDAAPLLQVVYTYSRRGLVQTVDALLRFLFWRSKMRRSELEAAMSKVPVDRYTMTGDPIKIVSLPILIACAVHCSDVGAFIKVLNFAQRCQAEGMVDNEGWTSLHHACGLGREHIVVTLTNACPHLLNIATPNGVTPLMIAADVGAVEILEHLLSLTKRDLSFQRDIDGRTVLHYAAASLNIPDETKAKRMIKILLNRAKGDKDLPLLLAGTVHDFRTVTHTAVKELLDTEMKDAQQSLSDLLQLAVEKQNWFTITNLINKGAKISTLDPETFSKLGLYGTKQLDQPNSKDSLGRVGLAKGIASLFLNPFAPLPITVGVFGSWGMGKSSIMLQAQIHILMTLIERNLLLAKMDNPKLIKVEELQHKVLKAVEALTCSKLNERESKFKVFWKCWFNSKKTKNKLQIEDFVSMYRPECMLLYKRLALMSRYDLFQDHSTEKHHGSTFLDEVPSCLTIYYNAWLYYGESDASSGLALTILEELEACMNTAQWLSLCWNYACREDPIFIFTSIYLPLLVLVVVGGLISWIIWTLMSTPFIANQGAWSTVKYGSIPISAIVSVWLFLRKSVNILRPVSAQILQSKNTSEKYKSRIGYQQQIINDIQFFKDHLGKKVGLGWRIVGKMWSLIFENKDNIPNTKIKKFQVSNDELRMVVFVDDLDRCADPKYILELLGATSLILSTCSINVVLGMDKNIISNVIQSELKYDREAVEKFLEKIINVPIDLFEPSGMETATFLEEQLMYTNSKRKEPFLEASNQSSFKSHKRQVEVEKTNLDTYPYLFSHLQRPLQQLEIKETHCFQRYDTLNLQEQLTSGFGKRELEGIQYFQGHVAVNLQEESPLDFESKQGSKIVMARMTQKESKSSKLNVPIMENEKEFLDCTSSIINKGGNFHDLNTSSTLEDKEPLGSPKEIYKREKNKLLVHFPLSLTNYNEAEVRVFQVLQKKAKIEQKKPRNWKRLLSYHQLVRSILLESQKDFLDYIFGWQQQLITWLFVCYNWKDQMNEIFENWEDLFIIQEPESVIPTWPSLHDMVSLQKKKHEKLLTIETDQKKRERNLKEWTNLEETLCGGYDVAMESIDIFQNYRFHCTIGHIHWLEDRGLSKN